MVKTTEGVYENGMIKPSESIELTNDSKVLITILTPEGGRTLNLELLTKEELLELAQQRVEQLKEAGVNRSQVAKDMLMLVDEIRTEAIKKGVAVNEEDSCK